MSDMKFQLLIRAIALRDADGCRALLAQGVNSDPEDSGRGLLFYAALNSSREVCGALLEAGANVDGSNDGWTALHAVATRGDDAMCAFLLERGARLDARDSRGRTPLEVAKGRAVQFLAAQEAQRLGSLLNQTLPGERGRGQPNPRQRARF